MTQPAPTLTDGKGFFATLFDLSFSSFITLKFLRVIYVVLLGAILLAGLVSFIGLLAVGGARAALAVLFVPVVTLIYVVLLRVQLEVLAMFFKIGENTSLLVARGPGSAPVVPPVL